MLRKYGARLAVLVVIGVVSILTVLFLLQTPEYVLLFAIVPLISLFLIVLLALRREYRVRFRELLMRYKVRFRKGGLLYRYGRALNAITIVVLVALCLAVYYNPSLVSTQYIPYAVLALFIALLISSFIFIAGFLKVAGKWGLIIIIVITMIAILRILLWQLST